MSAEAPRAAFRLELSVPGRPDAVWERLWDLDRHTAAIPLTRVWSLDGRPLRPGSGFVGRTGLGALGFDDRMQVAEWTPPRHAVVRKTGPWLRGTITVDLDADGGHTRLRWHQTFGARGVPDVVARMVAPLVARGYRVALHRILAGSAAAESEEPGSVAGRSRCASPGCAHGRPRTLGSLLRIRGCGAARESHERRPADGVRTLGDRQGRLWRRDRPHPCAR